MRHPEIVAVPILMLADYFLTLVGAGLAEQSYRRHFKSPYYELNPAWRGDVAKRRWFNPRHLLAVIVVTGGLYYIGEFDVLDDVLFKIPLGAVIGPLTVVVCRHCSNIVMFRFLRRHPDEVTGEVSSSAWFIMTASIAQTASILLLLAVILAFTRSAFVFGMIIGVAGLLIANALWIPRFKRASERTADATTFE